MKEIIADTAVDSIKLIPFLFLTYWVMEWLEHRTEDKARRIMEKSGRLGPLLGAVLGIFPQCGFSAAGSGLYAGRVITPGTLLAIYLSTSDEMLPIMISQGAPVGLMGRVLLYKIVIGFFAGFIVDLPGRKGRMGGKIYEERQEAGDGIIRGLCHCHCAGGRGHKAAGGDYIDSYGHASVGSRVDSYGHVSDGSRVNSDGYASVGSRVDSYGHTDGGSGKGVSYIFRVSCRHTLQVVFFIFLVTLCLNGALYRMGERALADLFLNYGVVGELTAGLIGMIPNCAASVTITQLYLEGVLNFGAMLSGLLTGSGVGLLVLYRLNRSWKENIAITGILYATGTACGILANALGLM